MHDDNDDNNDDVHVDSSSDISQSEALEQLLGGLGMADLSLTAWENQSEHSNDNDNDDDDDDDDNNTTNDADGNDKTTGPKTPRNVESPPTKSLREVQQFKVAPTAGTAFQEEEMFRRAYTCLGYCTRDGRVERPPLQIVYAGPERGNIALATRFLRKGETIFTERAAAAAGLTNPRRACPHCFKSLEPLASLCAANHSSPEAPNNTRLLPMPNLWPIPDYDMDQLEAFDSNTENSRHYLFRDANRRVFCQRCNVWFCHDQCLAAHEQEMGVSHCTVIDIERSLVDLDSDVQSAVLLAARLFIQLTAHFRRTLTTDGTFLEGLCGEATDVGPLELGLPENNNETRETHYTLYPFYQVLADKLQLTDSEQNRLNLTLFEKLAAIAARNSVGFRTQSPFKSYYAALLRHAGGWGSPRHATYMSQLAQALGRQQLDRGMDHEIEERVAPAVAGLFTLTARLNHSCEANAEIQSQVFVDCHIDIVATKDIKRDEEITISYLGPVRKTSNTARRRRELRAKYLFDCSCQLCSPACN